MAGKKRAGARPVSSKTSSRSAVLLLTALALLGLAAALAVAGWLGSRPAVPPSDASAGQRPPALVISPPEVDLGAISQAKGLVTIEATVANQGGSDLVISDMETTCGCTRAAVVVHGRPGPWFGMRGHGDWPTGWSARLRPGQQATLRVQYDPDAHGVYRGPVDRTVFVYSSDPAHPRRAFRFTGVQVP